MKCYWCKKNTKSKRTDLWVDTFDNTPIFQRRKCSVCGKLSDHQFPIVCRPLEEYENTRAGIRKRKSYLPPKCEKQLNPRYFLVRK